MKYNVEITHSKTYLQKISSIKFFLISWTPFEVTNLTISEYVSYSILKGHKQQAVSAELRVRVLQGGILGVV